MSRLVTVMAVLWVLTVAGGSLAIAMAAMA